MIGDTPTIDPGEVAVIQLEGEYGEDSAIEDGVLSVTSGDEVLAVTALTAESTTGRSAFCFRSPRGLPAGAAVVLGGKGHLGRLQ